MNTESQCDGRCFKDHDCSGVVQKVEVFDSYLDDTYQGYKSWGVFNYCQTAIETDTNNGFYVKILAQQ